MSEDLIIKGAKGIKDGLYVIKDGELFKYKPNRGTVYTVRSYHIIDRPRGEWNDIGGVIRWGCSLCHYAYDQKFNFCPNCGSDNRERSEE